MAHFGEFDRFLYLDREARRHGGTISKFTVQYIKGVRLLQLRVQFLKLFQLQLFPVKSYWVRLDESLKMLKYVSVNQ